MRASGRVAIGEDARIYTHWGARQDDGTMLCSCGWTSDGPVEDFEVYFLAHVQVEIISIIMDEKDLHDDRRETPEMSAVRALHALPPHGQEAGGSGNR